MLNFRIFGFSVFARNSNLKPLFGLWIWRRGFSFRFFYKGLWVAVDDVATPLFSERYGYTKVWRFWGLQIKQLK